MVPVTCDVNELDVTKVIVDRVHEDVKARLGVNVKYLYGTMIEIPRACLLADRMAKTSQFFSFGTNDLTQMTFGFSRDDIGGFLPDYIKQQHPPGRSVPDDRPGGGGPVDQDVGGQGRGRRAAT